MSFHAYLLRCSDGSYYAGHTDDLDARFFAHQNGTFRGYTYTRRPVELVWYQDFASRDEAFQNERGIKGWSRAKKEALIRGDWGRIAALAALRATDRPSHSGLDQTTGAARPSSASG
ncbi:MAG: GIY-YIG nuclease family protein [Dehalococcoidia bacterium]|nr:GIY-YIG nuclease family protein [Dehalococcoidia bacterium]